MMKMKRLFPMLLVAAGGVFFLASCGTGAEPTPAKAPIPTEAPPPPPRETPAPAPSGALSPVVEPTPREGRAPTPEPSPTPPPNLLPPGDKPGFSTRGWETNFDKHSVPYDELFSGGPPRDGIPPIYSPKFETISEASDWLKGVEPVVALNLGGDARAYPLQILIWHEIVADVVADQPVVVTFCPLCNTAIVFERTLEGKVYDFGTSGLLRYSDLVMWDHQTESLWQQATGEAIVGDLTGKRLTFVSAAIVSWADFKAAFPEGKVLSKDTGFSRSYGRNPYSGYDTSKRPFLFGGEVDERLAALERVVAVSVGEADVAYPFSVISKVRVIHDRVGGSEVVVFHQGGTTSALDGSKISTSRDVGAAAVFDPVVDGRRLSFEWRDGFRDRETGSTWNIFGQATGGPLLGKAMTPVVHGNHFWFAWAAFRPDTIVYQP